MIVPPLLIVWFKSITKQSVFVNNFVYKMSHVNTIHCEPMYCQNTGKSNYKLLQ